MFNILRPFIKCGTSVSRLIPSLSVIQNNILTINKGNSKSIYNVASKLNNVYYGESLLKVSTLVVIPSCGMKVKGIVKKRCKDCYIVSKDRRMYNYCKTHGRHFQMGKKPKDRAYFILTSVETYTKRKW